MPESERALRRIPVAAPVLAGREREYVLDCLDTTWISSTGRYVTAFEEGFAEFCGMRHAIGCCNGTVAVHLALLAAGVGPGDEVIVPTLTYVASANPILYQGATPVFVDSEPETWNMDPEAVASAITPRTKAIVVVHLYGHPADMDPIVAVAREHGVAVVEDAAEAHGAEYKGRRAGALGDVATFSFYGNKIITTGEGGMVLCDDDAVATLVRQLRGQGQDPQRRYWFPIVGFNYRMTNVAAAIGLGQLEMIDWHLERRREIAAWYAEELDGVPGVRALARGGLGAQRLLDLLPAARRRRRGRARRADGRARDAGHRDAAVLLSGAHASDVPGRRRPRSLPGRRVARGTRDQPAVRRRADAR